MEISGDAANSAVYTYMGILLTLRPPALGGEPERAREYFEKAIALTGGRDLGVKVEYARGYAKLLYERELRRIASKAGLAQGLADQAWASDRLSERLAFNLRSARALGISGTPAYVFGRQLLVGALPLARLEQALLREVEDIKFGRIEPDELARSLTDKDRVDLDFGLKLGIDWLALSFVQRPSDIMEARQIVGDRAGIMAKIEKPAALDRIDDIVALCDAIMVARGDLGVEIPVSEIERPVNQLHIVEKVADGSLEIGQRDIGVDASNENAPVVTR